MEKDLENTLQDNSGNVETGEPGSSGVSISDDSPISEDTNNAYLSVIDTQKETINVLLEQTQSLKEQIAKLVQGGAQINTTPEPEPEPEPEPYEKLYDLDFNLNKKDLYAKENK